MEMLSALFIAMGGCILAVNIIVEVLKTFLLKAEASRPLAVFITSEIVVFLAMYAYCVTKNEAFSLLLCLGGFAGGFFVAYGAMFGYEKLYGKVLESMEKAMTFDKKGKGEYNEVNTKEE